MGTKVYFNNFIFVGWKLTTIKIANTDLEWVDITNNEDAVKITLNLKRIIRRLHVIVDGEVVEELKLLLLFGQKYQSINFYQNFLNKTIIFYFSLSL